MKQKEENLKTAKRIQMMQSLEVEVRSNSRPRNIVTLSLLFTSPLDSVDSKCRFYHSFGRSEDIDVRIYSLFWWEGGGVSKRPFYGF